MDSKQRPQEFSSTVEQLGVHLRRLEPENSCSRCSKCGLFQTQHRNGRWTKTIQDYPRLLGLLVLDNLHRRTESPKDLAVTQLKKCRAPQHAPYCNALRSALSYLIHSYPIFPCLATALPPLCHASYLGIHLDVEVLRGLHASVASASQRKQRLLHDALSEVSEKKNHVTEGRIRPLLALCSNFETRLSFETFSNFANCSAWALAVGPEVKGTVYYTPLERLERLERFSAEELVSSKLWLDLESLSRAFRIEHCEHRIEHRLPPLDFDAVLSRRA